MNRTTTMTTGNPTKLILSFAFPMILANLGQQLYTIVDAMVVGQGVGVDALAAVGSSDWPYWFALWSVGALVQGFSISISQYFGEGNYAKLKKALTTSIFLCLGFGMLLTVLCLSIARPLLQLLQTPYAILDQALTYLIIMYWGILIIMAYNMSASVLRGLGDSKTPLIAIMIAGITNIILDLIFVLVFHLGIPGAAFASLIAQILAFLYCFQALSKMELMKLTKKDWQFDPAMILQQCRLGVPLALQHMLIVIGGMILQYAINKQGLIIIAGFTATNKIYGVLESSAISLGYAVSTYTAQNYGAGLYSRIRSGLKSAMVISFVISTTISATMILFGKSLLKLFIEADNANAPEVLNAAYQYLAVMCILLFTLYALYVARNTLQGLGISSASFWSGLMEFLARSSVALLAPLTLGKGAIYFAEPSAWIAADIVLVYACIKAVWKLPQKDVI